MPLEKPGTPEELVHFGIKGMRWGVRNRQDAINVAKNTKNLNKVLIKETPKAVGKSLGQRWNKLAKRSISSAQGPMSNRKKKLLRAADIADKTAAALLVASVFAAMRDKRSGNVFVREINRTTRSTSGKRFVNVSPAMSRTLSEIRNLPTYRG